MIDINVNSELNRTIKMAIADLKATLVLDELKMNVKDIETFEIVQIEM